MIRLLCSNSENVIDLKILSFCFELNIISKKLVKNLTVYNVKTFFNWLEETYKTSIKIVSALNNYWQLLKIFYVNQTNHVMNESMKTNYLNVKLLISHCMIKFAKTN